MKELKGITDKKELYKFILKLGLAHPNGVRALKNFAGCAGRRTGPTSVGNRMTAAHQLKHAGLPSNVITKILPPRNFNSSHLEVLP